MRVHGIVSLLPLRPTKKPTVEPLHSTAFAAQAALAVDHLHVGTDRDPCAGEKRYNSRIPSP
jgi:hypothetical protein